MTIAKDEKQFRKVWLEHIAQLRLLAQSLPLGDEALEFLKKVKDLEPYVEIAVKHVYETCTVAETPERDPTEDLPAHEEARRDYGAERGET